MRRRHAYTFVEIAIVVLAMGILAGVAAPKYTESMDYFRVESASKRVAADLRYARAIAARRASNQSVAFDLADDAYWLAGVADLTHGGDSYGVALADEGYESDLQVADFDGSATITFDHRGDCNASGGVVVIAGGQARYVVVTPPGEITIRKDNDEGSVSVDPAATLGQIVADML
ncbi:MAG: type II secretion system protein [Planctomycetota bacterium]